MNRLAGVSGTAAESVDEESEVPAAEEPAGAGGCSAGSWRASPAFGSASASGVFPSSLATRSSQTASSWLALGSDGFESGLFIGLALLAGCRGLVGPRYP